MGVHDLWSIVEPVRESVPLYSLSGKTLAVDLSLWVCEAQHVQAMMGRVTKPHLRNLFFRVSSLTLMGVKLVFVMEGEAPKLKAETMNKRTQERYGGFKKASAPKSKTSTSRGRFNSILRECAEMLDYMGVPWVTAAGEAEAMCAYLDSQGLVDGCITNDGDAFLYGARTVYRNFNMTSKDPQVDCYRTSRVETELRLSRENLVGLAIFLGCDYIPKGIPGVGREQALRLIQMLKGQTLLQRFSKWKEESVCVSEGAVKKVAHCLVCRHPGSAKAHERSGCVLCCSKHYCEPQDFDYQCPCDWHRSEQTRQALSFEANVRKKTLASAQFPFTEIINEFLISKDKPVSHFKRRQPNMLLMQKFAYDKLEWPKHYTSEKLLVLMTYTELMNRKSGRQASVQIKPLRILKARVRNAVACLEVIWSTPDHFVFPEERPAEEQHEVRTVEEESLVRVAFPDMVESYLRGKALADENKKKKPRAKKEKPSDLASDDISNLLAQMSLQSSSIAPLQPLPPATEQPDVVVLDTPPQKQQKSRAALSHVQPAAASPSVSAVIEALHLSDVDWDALSFTSSPAPQPAAHRTAEPETAGEERGAESTEQKTLSNVREADSTSAPGLRHTDCSLRDRVLMRNAAEAADQEVIHDAAVSKHLRYESASLQQGSQGSKPDDQPVSKGSLDRKVAVHRTEPLTDKSQFATSKTNTHSSRQQPRPAGQTSIDKSNGPQKKYTFIKKDMSSLAVRPQRCLSDPGQSGKNRPKTTKKSVCVSVGSSSEDSDSENQKVGRQSKAKVKSSSLSASSQKTTAKPPPALWLKPLSCGLEMEKSSTPVAAKKSHGASPATVAADVFPQTPEAPVSESDDSVISCDSPLPLAERLRLKFLK